MKNRQYVMIPGPTPVHQDIQYEMGRETAAFKDPAFIQDFKDVIRDLKELLKTDGEVFVVAGTGTMAMEMAVSNILQKDHPVLLISHGFFGDRFIEISSRKKYDLCTLSSPWGETVDLDLIEKELNKREYKALIVTHVDTSTGTRAPIKEIGSLVKDKETLFVVDGVCATGAEVEDMKDMGIDLLFTASQKAFGVPPGLAMVWASPEAMKRRESFDEIPEYYIDFHQWLPIMHNPDLYFGTPPVNLIWALKASIELMKEEGLDERYARHERDARAIQAAIEELGFPILAEEGCRSVTLTNPIYPEGIDDGEFRSIPAEEGVIVAGGLGDYAGKLFRLGHMGHIDRHIIVATLAAIERTLYRVGGEVSFGRGVGTYLAHRMEER